MAGGAAARPPRVKDGRLPRRDVPRPAPRAHFLGLRPWTPEEAAAAERLETSDELAGIVARGHALPADRQVLGRVRGFYRPFNRALAAMLGDDAFLWRDFERIYYDDHAPGAQE